MKHFDQKKIRESCGHFLTDISTYKHRDADSDWTPNMLHESPWRFYFTNYRQGQFAAEDTILMKKVQQKSVTSSLSSICFNEEYNLRVCIKSTRSALCPAERFYWQDPRRECSSLSIKAFFWAMCMNRSTQPKINLIAFTTNKMLLKMKNKHVKSQINGWRSLLSFILFDETHFQTSAEGRGDL